MLEALLSSIEFVGTSETGSVQDRTLGEARASLVADNIIAKRPFAGWADFDGFLDKAVENGLISRAQKRLLLVHGYNSQDRDVWGGTAPFCFSSSGTFRVRTAVSDNYKLSRKERARLFSAETVSIAPSGALTEVILSQRDFQDHMRLSRMGRYWTTEPQYLSLFDSGSQPPREILPDLYQDLNRYASNEARESFLRLAPCRISSPPANSGIIHFDQGAYLLGSYLGMESRRWIPHRVHQR